MNTGGWDERPETVHTRDAGRSLGLFPQARPQSCQQGRIARVQARGQASPHSSRRRGRGRTMQDDAPYKIGRFRGGLAITFDVAGKRRRYQLNARTASDARREAPTLYAALTRPKGKTVSELWQG